MPLHVAELVVADAQVALGLGILGVGVGQWLCQFVPGLIFLLGGERVAELQLDIPHAEVAPHERLVRPALLAGIVENLRQTRAGFLQQGTPQLLRAGAILQLVLNTEDKIAVGVHRQLGPLLHKDERVLHFLRLRPGFVFVPFGGLGILNRLVFILLGLTLGRDGPVHLPQADPQPRHEHRRHQAPGPLHHPPPFGLLGRLHLGLRLGQLRLLRPLLCRDPQGRHPLRHFVGILRSISRFKRQTLLHQGNDFRLRVAGVEPCESVLRLTPQGLLPDALRIPAGVGRLAGEQLAPQRPQAEHIRRRADAVDLAPGL
ncbi:MAG: hypothetical protein NZ700_01600, partial [Gemmataceae bacterium]|nr:hypothetical protein [Gemmataceae bacterium]